MTPVRNLLAICATSGFLVLSRAEASAELSHDIAAQPLAQALSEFATQTDLQVVYVSGIAATQTSKRATRGRRLLMPPAPAGGYRAQLRVSQRPDGQDFVGRVAPCPACTAPPSAQPRSRLRVRQDLLAG
jgi:hypothetical protein